MKNIDAKYMGMDSITGSFAMISFGGFPGVVHADPNEPLCTIFGEVYATDEEGLACLDLLESHPNWYERFKYRSDIHSRRVWMYTLPRGAGYLDATRYDRVESCIWRPTEPELKFWNSQDGIEINA
jgi:gamma-glutamylcyclotransferase (GGCT)/AIG2-like uncharacterized protein YtfP